MSKHHKHNKQKSSPSETDFVCDFCGNRIPASQRPSIIAAFVDYKTLMLGLIICPPQGLAQLPDGVQLLCYFFESHHQCLIKCYKKWLDFNARERSKAFFEETIQRVLSNKGISDDDDEEHGERSVPVTDKAQQSMFPET